MPARTTPARPSLRAAATRTLLTALVVTGLPLAASAPATAHRGGSGWECLAHHESTHRWHVNTGNGHFGGLQFSLSTWRYYGGPHASGNTYPHNATRAEQIRIGKRTAWHGWKGRKAQGGRNAWPNTWSRCF